MKILTVVGARPQFIKSATVSRALRKHPEIEEIILHTGQHFDHGMSQVFFDELKIEAPKYNLDIHGMQRDEMLQQMTAGISLIIQTEKPDWVLVYGDTNSTLAGARAAKNNRIKLAHVEAGLRSFNLSMPEEHNRTESDRLSDVLFVPTPTGMENLANEGLLQPGKDVLEVGDVMFDASLYFGGETAQPDFLKDLGSDFLLCTFHRAENTDDVKRLKSIVNALNQLSKEHEIVLPLHPRTLQKLVENGLELSFPTIEPVGYLDMIALLKHCKLVLTDSGGLQKEAFFFQKNCVTLRDDTEWVELLSGGYSVLAGADYQKIITSVDEMLNRKNSFSADLYGGGKASERIADYFASRL
jgi:UDP-GlcNAc3NAcA epimerase